MKEPNVVKGGELTLEGPTSGRRYFLWLLFVGMVLALAVLFPTSKQRIFAQTGGYGYGGGTGDTLGLGTLTLSPTSGPVKTEVHRYGE